MKPGIYPGIPNSEYHGGPGDSKSGLDLIARSPLHYRCAKDAANDNEPTIAQRIGTAAHAAILEPALFVQEYCLALQREDVPHAIDDREQLAAMVAKLNEGRLPKLPTSGAKAALVELIFTEGLQEEPAILSREELEAMKGAELKAVIERANEKRTGLPSTSGNRHELAELLRANGVAVTLWSDVLAEWQQNNGHRIVMSKPEWEMIARMRHAVMAHPAASHLLLRGKNVVIDLKTTDDASPEGFSKSIANWRYDVQAAFYLDGLREALRQANQLPPVEGVAELSAYWVDQETGVLCRCRPDFWHGEPKHFAFIAVEKKPPHAVAVYVLDDDSMASGRAQYRANLETLAACKANDNWPGYGDKVQTISVPAWHLRKNEHLVSAS